MNGFIFLVRAFLLQGGGSVPHFEQTGPPASLPDKAATRHLSFLASTWASVKLCHFLPNPKNGSSGPRGGSGDEVNTSEQIYLWVKRLP